MSWTTKLFGSTPLQKGKEEVEVVEALKGKKVVGIYFSAHWCGPCRSFTPMLTKTYKKMKEANPNDMEIVFVSSDRTASDFDKYYAEMPWLALDFDERETKAKLSKKFKVQGIPTFVLVDGQTGETISTDGRSSVMSDPEGKDFPWKPKSFDEAIGDAFEKKDGSVINRSTAMAGKYLGIYFSASWCPPCKAFSPVLVGCYEKLMAAGKNVEFLFVSSDRDDASYKEYRSHFPFLSIPFADRKRKAELSEVFGVEGIPHFVLIGPDGKIVNANARGAVMGDPNGEKFPWIPEPVTDVAEGPEGINETCSFLLFTRSKSDAIVPNYIAMAKQYLKDNAEDDDKQTLFFIGYNTSPVEKRIKELLHVSQDANLIAAILDIPNERFVLMKDTDKITAAEIKTFCEDYHNGKLEKQCVALS